MILCILILRIFLKLLSVHQQTSDIVELSFNFENILPFG
jgi:hypothetical protein